MRRVRLEGRGVGRGGFGEGVRYWRVKGLKGIVEFGGGGGGEMVGYFEMMGMEVVQAKMESYVMRKDV